MYCKSVYVQVPSGPCQHQLGKSRALTHPASLQVGFLVSSPFCPIDVFLVKVGHQLPPCWALLPPGEGREWGVVPASPASNLLILSCCYRIGSGGGSAPHWVPLSPGESGGPTSPGLYHLLKVHCCRVKTKTQVNTGPC